MTRSEVIVVRVDPLEKQVLAGEAAALGISVSDLLRRHAFEEPSHGAPEKTPKPGLFTAAAIAEAYRCPDNRCDRRFASGHAVCPIHGRTAVPA